MSVDPTPYDALQDDRLERIEELVSSEYTDDGGTEVSFPVVDQGMDDEQWGALMKAFGSGVISFGQFPYRMIVDDDADVTNQVRITPATDMATKDSVAVIEGFAHRLLEDKMLTIPAVSTRTKYTVALQYDPVRAKDEGTPVILDVFAGTLDQTQGKKYVLVYEGYRDSSSVLSQMEWTPVRSRLAPTITVQRKEHLPNPQHSGLIWGTRCYCSATGEEYLLSHHPTEDYMRWQLLDPAFLSPPWVDVKDNSSYPWPGHGSKRGYRKIGDTLELRGRFTRASGDNFKVGGGGSGFGYYVFNVAAYAGEKIVHEQRFITASAGNQYQKLCVVTVTAEGELYVMPVLEETPWVSIDGVRVMIR